jgi:hypothetical protein
MENLSAAFERLPRRGLVLGLVLGLMLGLVVGLALDLVFSMMLAALRACTVGLSSERRKLLAGRSTAAVARGVTRVAASPSCTLAVSG